MAKHQFLKWKPLVLDSLELADIQVYPPKGLVLTQVIIKHFNSDKKIIILTLLTSL